MAPFGRRPRPPHTPRGESLPARQAPLPNNRYHFEVCEADLEPLLACQSQGGQTWQAFRTHRHRHWSTYNVHIRGLIFEWDDRKDRANLEKHGVSFEEARTAFYDENAIVFFEPDHSADENRFILPGLSFKPGL